MGASNKNAYFGRMGASLTQIWALRSGLLSLHKGELKENKNTPTIKGRQIGKTFFLPKLKF
jgi:hypothetical protein